MSANQSARHAAESWAPPRLACRNVLAAVLLRRLCARRSAAVLWSACRGASVCMASRTERAVNARLID
jgi:hypothetical protein